MVGALIGSLVARPDARAQAPLPIELPDHDQASSKSIGSDGRPPLGLAPPHATEPIRLVQANAALEGAGNGQAARVRDSAGLFDDFSLTLGPIRYGGAMATDFRLAKSDNQSRTAQRVEYINVVGSTYLWQPWFAQLRAAGGVVLSQARSTGDPAQANASSTSGSDSFTGELSASVFPLSRFPFEVFGSRSDSRVSGDLAGSDFTSTRFGIRQTYIPPQGDSRYTARLERNTLSSSLFGDDTVNLIEATTSHRLGPHTFELSGNHTTNTGGLNGASSRFDRLNARHNWTPATNVQVESMGSATRSLLRAGSTVAGLSNIDSRFLQLTSFGTWRPEEGERFYDEDRPLYLTATGRLFSIANETAGESSQSLSMSGSLGANYTLTPNMRLTAALNVAHTRTDTTADFFTTQLGSVIYTPPATNLGPYVYTWSASGSAANFTSSNSGGRQNLSSQVSHSVLRSFALTESSRINVTGNQGLGIAYDTTASAVGSINHGAGITWISGTNAGSQSYVSLSAADARSLGGTGNSFQLVNLQATRQSLLNRVSYWAGNLTVQWTRQTIDTVIADPNSTTLRTALIPVSTSGSNVTATGNLSYFHQRVFGVPRLRFGATFTAASQQFDTRLQGNIDARREHVSSSLEGRLDYTIGRLDVRLTARTAVIDGRSDQLIFLRLTRQFGAF